MKLILSLMLKMSLTNILHLKKPYSRWRLTHVPKNLGKFLFTILGWQS
jgi:hypothetical protein